MLNGLPRGELEEEARREFAIDRQELLGAALRPARRGRRPGVGRQAVPELQSQDEGVRAALGQLPTEHQFP